MLKQTVHVPSRLMILPSPSVGSNFHCLISIAYPKPIWFKYADIWGMCHGCLLLNGEDVCSVCHRGQGIKYFQWNMLAFHYANFFVMINSSVIEDTVLHKNNPNSQV